MEFSVSAGYQSGELHWSIAGNLKGQSPDVLSELQWKALRGPLFNAGLKINFLPRWFISGNYAKSYVVSGSATDTDYAKNQRQEPTYRAELSSNDGDFRDLRLEAGYRLFVHQQFDLSVTAGYTGKYENLLLMDPEGAKKDRTLHSTYQTGWKGFTTGISAAYKVLPVLMLCAGISYDQLSYKSQADWNLIDAFQHPLSFEQKANGYQLGVSLGYIYQIKPYLSLKATGIYDHAETGKGVDQLFKDDGSVQSTQFNGVVKNVKSISLGLVVRF